MLESFHVVPDIDWGGHTSEVGIGVNIMCQEVVTIGGAGDTLLANIMGCAKIKPYDMIVEKKHTGFNPGSADRWIVSSWWFIYKQNKKFNGGLINE